MAVTLKTDWAAQDELEAAELNKITKKLEALTDGVYNSSDAPENIRLGTSSKSAPLVIDSDINSGGAAGDPIAIFEGENNMERVYIRSYGGDPTLRFENSGGDKTTPTAVADGDWLGGITVKAHDGSDFQWGGWQQFSANGAWSASNRGIDWSLYLTPNGSTSYKETIRAQATSSGGRLGIGTEPSVALHLVNDGDDIAQYLDSYGGNPSIAARSANGSKSSPSASVDSEDLFSLKTYGHDGSGFQQGADFVFEADGAWGGSNRGTVATLKLVPNGATAMVDVAKFSDDGLDLPTSGDYFSRGGTPITQKVANGAVVTRNSNGSTGTGAVVDTGLDEIDYILVWAVSTTDDASSFGKASGTSSEFCLFWDFDVSPSVGYNSTSIIDVGPNANITNISGGVFTLYWAGFSSQTVSFSWSAFGH